MPTLQKVYYDTGYTITGALDEVTIHHQLGIPFEELRIDFFFKKTTDRTAPLGREVHDVGDVIRMNSAMYCIGDSANTAFGVSAYYTYNMINNGYINDMLEIFRGEHAVYTQDPPVNSGACEMKWASGLLRVVITGYKYV